MIQVKTRLDDGIYKSQGGGVVRIVSEHKRSPRGLVNAVRSMYETHNKNVRGYGNIGAGATWIEIDGKKIRTSGCELIGIERARTGFYGQKNIIGTATELAEKLLQEQ